jgi:hypothetical protein
VILRAGIRSRVVGLGQCGFVPLVLRVCPDRCVSASLRKQASVALASQWSRQQVSGVAVGDPAWTLPGNVVAVLLGH